MAFFKDLRRKWHVAGLERQAATQRSRMPGALAGLPRWAIVLLTLLGLGLLYYGPLGWAMADTDTDLTLRPPAEKMLPGGSMTAAMTSTLVLAELDRGGWTPNDTIFKPTAFNDEMPAFQRGVHDVVLAGTQALSAARPGEDELAEAAEDFAVDPGLRTARGSFPFFGRSAGGHYRDGAEMLSELGTRMADGNTDPFTRPATARRLVSAIGGTLAAGVRDLDAVVRAPERLDESGESIAVRHAHMRGQAYAATLLLRGVQADFDPVLRDRQLAADMVEAVESLDAVAGEDVFFADADDLTRQAYVLRTGVAALSRVRAGLGS